MAGPLASLYSYFQRGLQVLDDWFGPPKPRPVPPPTPPTPTPTPTPAPTPTPTPTPTPPTPPLPPPTPPKPAPTELEKLEQQLFEAHNQKRKDHGKPAYKWNEKLRDAARKHSDYQAQHGQMGHFLGDGSPWKRIQAAGYAYSAAGENVAWNQQSVDQVMTSWMWSPGHRMNILGGYTEIGCSMTKGKNGDPYWTACFGTPAAGGVSAGAPAAGQDFATMLLPPGGGQLCVGWSSLGPDIPG